MTAPAHMADASDLLAVVERARALLDDGDVIAARMLAAGAYDQAKAAAAYGERFGAAERLVRKAHRLQGDALLIEARAKVKIADEYDAAQARGDVRKPGQRGKAVADDDSISAPTADEIGLSRQEIHEARKLRDAERGAPGIVERAIAARLAAALEPSRASLRAAIGTRSATRQERGNNLYETPPEAMAALLALEDFSARVWEPACGRGAILRVLEDAGHEVIISDLVDYGTANRDGECQEVGDFLQTRLAADGVRGAWRGALPVATDIVTNPPYGEALNAFVAHALREHRPRKMALLLNLNFLCGTEDGDRNFALDDNPPARILVFSRRLPMMHRDGYDGKKSTSQMNTAWFVWEQGEDGEYRGGMQVRRVDWKDYAASPATSSRPDEEAVAAPPPAASAMAGAEPPPSAPATSSSPPPAPGFSAPVEFHVGGMEKGSFARFSIHKTPEGTFAISARYELAGYRGGASPATGTLSTYAKALTAALDDMVRQLQPVLSDQSSVCRHHHRAAARAALNWIAARRNEWGLATEESPTPSRASPVPPLPPAGVEDGADATDAPKKRGRKVVAA